MQCIFCQIIEGKIPAKIIYQDELVIAFEDINPRAPIHEIIIPRKHIATLDDITDDDLNLMGHITLVAKKIARQLNVSDSGYRLVVNCKANAGQEVMHIHFHLLAGRRLTWPLG
jgi:histidine triad (HIT) family protein